MSNLPSQSAVQETAGFLGGLVRQARLIWLLLKDRRVPAWVKLIPAAAVIYFLSPIDLVPDMLLPGLGELDDLAILLISLKTFVNLAPPGVVREHLATLAGKPAGQKEESGEDSESVIDASYRIIGSDKDEADAP
jgi:uncharacterized membrane protein YkvA (DUF1232 family)